MTNSPPSNVKMSANEPARVLASGIDTLGFSLQVNWLSRDLFKLLGDAKQDAKYSKTDEPVTLRVGPEENRWLFSMKEHGVGGYEWLIYNKDCALRIGNWTHPIQRPSIMVDVRSEALWMRGADTMVQRIVELIRALGGNVWEIKSSRVDICADVLLPKSAWTLELESQFITKAARIDSHTSRRKLTGFSIGKGKISARLYDKPEEIRSKSGKYWMYDIWGIDRVPHDYVIVRVEFSFRRDRLRKFGCKSWDDTKANLPGLWAYATQKWLRIPEDASIHHTQQKLIPWWDTVMNGFEGAQGAEPLVQDKAVSYDLTRHALQVVGGLTSIIGISLQDEVVDTDYPVDFDSSLSWALQIVKNLGRQSDIDFTERVIQKQARYCRHQPDFEEWK
jgi:hypothetical protein